MDKFKILEELLRERINNKNDYVFVTRTHEDINSYCELLDLVETVNKIYERVQEK